jgi:tRNA dimethylallyltransferase
MSDRELSSVIAIVGPTASGKTDLAVRIAGRALAQRRAVTVFSLDSRQIYRELPLISCADVQVWRQLQSEYAGKLRVCNLADKSLAQWWSVGQTLAEFAAEYQRLPTRGVMIAVGGSLMYQRQLWGENDATQIPPDDNVRFAAEKMTVEQLQEWLQRVDGVRWEQLNPSDQANPRRLIRKIEMAIYMKVYPEQMSRSSLVWGKVVMTQPRYRWEEIEVRIRQRVQQRWSEAVVAEVVRTQQQYPRLAHDKQWQARLPLWWREISKYVRGEIGVDECQRWCALRDWQYAKRQRTWLKKLLSDYTHLVDEREILTD